MGSETALCPSARCSEGALLLGLIGSNGEVLFLSDPLTITDDFVEAAKRSADPQQRFRFANRCLEAGCTQWTGERCGVIDSVMDQIPAETSSADSTPDGLRPCRIRSSCRWYGQRGSDACAVCPLVITEVAAER